MSERVTRRHRAPQRASTPLTVLGEGVSQAIGEHAGTIGRGGAVVAVSSGLLASLVALPAGATSLNLQSTGTTTTMDLSQAGAIANVPAANPTVSTLTAPTTATVVFDRGALNAESTPTSRAAAREARRAERRALAAKVTQSVPTATTTTADEPAETTPAAPAQEARVAEPVEKPTTSAKKSSTTTQKTATVAKKTATVAKKTTAAATVKKKAATAAKKTTAAATTKKKTAAAATVTQGVRSSAVVSVARRYQGIYYRYGGTTPRGFDCSGFTQYVYRQMGVSLPRVATAQMHATRSIPASAARAGDLVFFSSGGGASHVGIVSRPGYMIDSPRTGKAVSERKIYSSRVVYRRVTG